MGEKGVRRHGGKWGKWGRQLAKYYNVAGCGVIFFLKGDLRGNISLRLYSGQIYKRANLDSEPLNRAYLLSSRFISVGATREV